MLVGGSSFTEVTVRQVRIIQAVKTDHPFVIIGDVNDTLLLPEYAADWAVTQGYAVETGVIPVVQTHADLIPDKPRVIDPAVLVSDPDAHEEPEPPKRPYGNQPKSMWATYAAAVDPDMTVERAEGMTKADLMSQYGERL